MAVALLLFAVSLLHFSETQGSSDVTTVYVQKGKNLHLDVQKPVVLLEDTEFRWRFNNTDNVVRLFPDNRIKIIPSYVGRAEVSLQNHSFCLKNVQQNDSGDYTAHITGDKEQSLAEYKVIIQDPVSPVNLTVNSVPNSTESCNLAVSCNTEQHSISSTFRCDDQTCYQEEGEQSKGTTSFLHVHLLNDSIICKHSNRVSQKEVKKGIRDFCPLKTVLNLGHTIAIGSGILVFLCLLICGLFIIYKRKKNCENTVYAFPQDINLSQRPNQNATEDASGCTTYSTVGFPTGPTGSIETENTTQPETIYAQVTKVPKSNHHPKNTTPPETIYAKVTKAPMSDHHPELENNVYSQDIITVSHEAF